MSQLSQRLNTKEAAAYAGVSSSYLCKLRVFGSGPKFLKIGRRVAYEPGDIDAWLAAHRHGSTSEYTTVGG